MALIGSVNNQGSIQGQINEANGYLTGVISDARLLGGQVVGMRGLKGDKGDKGDTGDTGATGVGISSVAKTGTAGKVDTYTITYSDGNSTTFTVTNGNDGTNGQDGHSPVVTATKSGTKTYIYVDGTQVAEISDGSNGAAGNGIASIALTSSTGTDPVVDTYTVTYTDGNSDTFTVTNGTKGDTGATPVITATKAGKVTTIKADGTDIATINDGDDGHSPVVTASKVGKVTTVYVDGTAIATINDGDDAGDTKVTQTTATASSYTYWRPLVIGYSSSATEGFTPSTATNTTYTFNTLSVQPSTGSIRCGVLDLYSGSYTIKTSVSLTGNRTLTLQDKSGTVALTSDIPSVPANLSDLTNDMDVSDFPNDAGYLTSAHEVPSGGSSGQVLAKASGTDYDLTWTSDGGGTVTSVGAGVGLVTDQNSNSPITGSGTIKAKLRSETPMTDASKVYPLQIDGNGDLVTKVGWSDIQTRTSDSGTERTIYLAGGATASDETGGLSKHGSVNVFVDANTTSAGATRLSLGNSTASDTAGGKEGSIRLYGSSTSYTDLKVGASTTAKTISFPDATGTVALTSDMPTKTSDLSNDSYFARGKVANFYGTCATAAAAKTVVCADFTSSDLTEGVTLIVEFSAANTGAVADLTLDVNSTGAYHIKYNNAGTLSNLGDKSYIKASTYMFYFTGTYWVLTGYDTNTNTIGYTIRHNGSSLPMKNAMYRYRIMFTSADGNYYVSANASSSTSATASKTVTTEKIDPFGDIFYYSTTTAVSAGSRPAAANTIQQYNGVTLGYSFNRTGAALTLTSWKPVYIKCAPQTDGSATIDADNPFVQALPSTADGKIYIFLGIATAATTIELTLQHPVYYYKDGAIREWTNQVPVPTKVSDLTNDSYFVTLIDVDDYLLSASIIRATDASSKVVLDQMTGDSAATIVPSSITTMELLAANMNPRVWFAWLNGTTLEFARLSATVNTGTTAITLNLVGKTSVASGVMGVDNSWTVTANPTIPTDTSDLTNGAGFITLADLPVYNGGVS